MTWRSSNTQFSVNQDSEATAQTHLDNYWRTRGVTVDRKGACKSRDAIYHTRSDNQFKVEEKFRLIGSVRGDFLLEIVQALEAGDLGWFAKTDADLLVYVLCDELWRPLVIYWLFWPEFRQWYLTEYLVKHKVGTYIASTKGYGVTINLAIKVSDIPDRLYSVIDLRK